MTKSDITEATSNFGPRSGDTLADSRCRSAEGAAFKGGPATGPPA
jgi:hypothetical protein